MRCPKCNIEYMEGYTKCTDCGEELVQSDVTKERERGSWLFTFGETTAKSAISLLFYISLLPLLFTSIIYGKNLYLTNTYMKGISFMNGGQKVYTEMRENNLLLGIIGGILFFAY